MNPTPAEVEEILARRDWFMRRYLTLEARFAYVRKRRREWLTNGRASGGPLDVPGRREHDR